MLHVNANELYGHPMSQPLPYDGIEMWHGHPDFYTKKLEEILKTPDDNDSGYFVEVDLGYPDNIKEKHFPFALENKAIAQNNGYMKKKT